MLIYREKLSPNNNSITFREDRLFASFLKMINLKIRILFLKDKNENFKSYLDYISEFSFVRTMNFTIRETLPVNLSILIYSLSILMSLVIPEDRSNWGSKFCFKQC